MRALQNLPVVSEYTHDSFYVGEDGPTHQPIEHIMACRAIPNLLVLRPGDANEAVVASRIAFEQKNRPSVILLTRQGLPVLDRNIHPSAEEFRKGGYIVSDCKGVPEVTIIATGSEVWVALETKKLLSEKQVRVVNLGCWKLFEEQSADYKESVLGRNSGFRVSIEAGITMGWERYTGINGLNIGIDTFGESAPGDVLADYFGLTPEKVAQKIASEI
jgi:transketolase